MSGRLFTEYATCPGCDRTVAVYNPRHGDGSVRVTHWHKLSGGGWCRREIEVEDVRRCRNPAAVRPDAWRVVFRGGLVRHYAHPVPNSDFVITACGRRDVPIGNGAGLTFCTACAAADHPDHVPTRTDIAEQVRVVDASQRHVDDLLGAYQRAARPDDLTDDDPNTDQDEEPLAVS